jgi:hypothetical protein
VTFKWQLLLQVATNLLASSPEEREYRSAINRAYYAAYGEARDYSETHGLVFNGKRPSHEQVWQFLRSGATYSQSWQALADLIVRRLNGLP